MNPKKNAFLSYLKHYATESAKHRDYQSAKIADKMYNKLYYDLKNVEEDHSISQEELERYEESKEELKHKHEMEIQKLQEKRDEELESLNYRQEIEKNEFENNWRTKIPIKYRKPSKIILHLKHMEESLINLSDFEKAELVQQELDNLTLIETEENQKKILDDYKNSKNMLEQKFQEELNYLEHQFKVQNDALKSKQQIENSNFENRLAKLELKNEFKRPKEPDPKIIYYRPKSRDTTNQLLLNISSPIGFDEKKPIQPKAKKPQEQRKIDNEPSSEPIIRIPPTIEDTENLETPGIFNKTSVDSPLVESEPGNN